MRIQNALWRLALTSIYMALITLTAAAMPFFGDFVSICGAIGFTPLDFVFPALGFLKSGRMPKNGRLKLLVQIINIAIAIWFSFVAILGCIGAVRFIVIDIKTYKFFHDMWSHILAHLPVNIVLISFLDSEFMPAGMHWVSEHLKYGCNP